MGYNQKGVLIFTTWNVGRQVEKEVYMALCRCVVYQWLLYPTSIKISGITSERAASCQEYRVL